jgi:hypothetical protein
MDINALQVEWLRYENMKPEVGGSSAGSHEAHIFHMKNRMTVGSLMVLKNSYFFYPFFGFLETTSLPLWLCRFKDLQ